MKLRCVCWRAGRELVCVLSSTGHEVEMCVCVCVHVCVLLDSVQNSCDLCAGI